MAIESKKTKSKIIEFLTIVASIIALIVSVRSCTISDRALQVSKDSLLFDNRPYVIIKPRPVKDTGRYLLADVVENELRFEMEFEIKNVGKVPAQNMSIDKSLLHFHLIDADGNEVTTDMKADYSLPPDISLGPNQLYAAHIIALARLKSKEALGIVEELQNGRRPVGVEIALSYECIISDKTYIFRVITENLLFKDQVVLVSSFMD